MKFPSKKGNLKLQKLLYYSNIISLVTNNIELFPEPIEAWSEGPVVRSAYVQYRYFDLWNETVCNLMEETISILKSTLNLFDNFTADELVEMTHQEEPWKVHENSVGPYNKVIIDRDSMAQYYKDFINRQLNPPREERFTIGGNTYIYEPSETELTDEDKKNLERDFLNVVGQEIFVYKDCGELVAY